MSYQRALIFFVMSLGIVWLIGVTVVCAEGVKPGSGISYPTPQPSVRPPQYGSYGTQRAATPQTNAPMLASPQVSSIFKAPQLYPTGANGTSSIVAIDVNGDGKLDLVMANPCVAGSVCQGAVAGDVSVLLGNGDGTFQAPTIHYADTGINSLWVADVNGDGKPDLLVCGFSATLQSTVSVELGNGDGTFQSPIKYPSPAGCGAITAADLNGDGKTDLVVGGGSVGVLLGNGDGTFQPEVVYSSGGSGTAQFVVADVNKDGKPDLIVANVSFSAGTNNGSVAVLLGNGDGTFQSPVDYGSGGWLSYSVAVADLNGDGNLDLVVTNYYKGYNDQSEGSVGVLLGNGDGTFRPAVTYNLGLGYGLSVMAIDVNHDGIPDLLVSGGCLNVQIGNGDGTFQPAVSYDPGTGFGVIASVADVNGDGNPDALVRTQYPGNGPAAVSVMFGADNGTFWAPRIYSSNSSNNKSTAAADVNGDGNQDLIVVNQCFAGGDCPTNPVGVLLGNGDGTFQPQVSYGSGGLRPYEVAVADLNNDGYLDLIVANDCVDADCKKGAAGVLLGNGDGTFKAAVSYPSSGQDSYSVAVGDINGDGKPDIVVTNFCAVGGLNCTNGSVSVLLGNGDGTFRPAVSYPVNGVDTVTVDVADINGDGFADVVVGSWWTGPNTGVGAIEVLLAKGDGTLLPPVSQSFVGSGPQVVAFRDINGNGKLDLVALVGCTAPGNCANAILNVLPGNGDGTFQSPITTLTPGITADYTDPLAIADFNGDGKVDVAFGVGDYLLLGNGDGTFQTPVLLGAAGIGIAAGDFNGDGKPDLGVGGVAVLMNVTPGGKTASLTKLVASAPSSTYGQNLTFTAYVTSQGAGTPPGTVTFTQGALTLGTELLTNGTAVLNNSSLSAGTDSVKATYSGDSNFSPSSSKVIETVAQATTITTLASSANPSYLNQTVAFTATITSQFGGAVSGSVTFKQGTTTLATVPLSNGQATYNTTYTTTGTRSITAVYAGDNNNQGSTSPVLKQVVNSLPAATKTSLTTSGTPSFIHQPVTFTATVTSTYGPIPDGELVTFYDGTTALSSVPLSGGVATYTTSSLKAGSHTIKATYPGDATFKSSTKSITQVVNLYPTSTSISSSLNPSAYGQAVTFTATVTAFGPYALTGKVTFKDGTTGIGTVALSGGIAILKKSNLTVGSHSITAQYLGDSSNAKSTSPVLNQVVQ